MVVSHALRAGRGRIPWLRWLSLGFLVAAIALTALEMAQYSRLQNRLPVDTMIAGVPVGGLTRDEAIQRLLEVYSTPVELVYDDAVIWLEPAAVGFELDFNSMFGALEASRQQRSFWRGFWEFLWGRRPPRQEVPLVATYSQTRLRAFLQDIAARYDQPPLPPRPIVGTTQFEPGRWGTQLNQEQAIPLIERALFSPTDRRVNLPIRRVPPTRLALHNLEVLLKQTIDLAGFDGLVGLYLYHLGTGEELHFVYHQGQDVPIPPDVSFTAASVIKVPIMVSVLRRIDLEKLPPNSETERWLREMITKSGNDPSDWLMENVLDPIRGPLLVTADMRYLGLENTFLAGFFYPGAPLLARYETPGNQRTDVNTDPDPYNQTSPSDIGSLFVDMYQCASRGGGLAVAFPGEITRAECQYMLDLLAQNRIGALLEASVPEGTRVAHKHGWVPNLQGGMHVINDSGVIYTPNGDYVLSIFLYRDGGLYWGPHSKLLQNLARAVYNYYNPPAGGPTTPVQPEPTPTPTP